MSVYQVLRDPEILEVNDHAALDKAMAMEPAPSNFHEKERQISRSLYDLYNTISLGVPGTAMSSFAHLSDEQRWALAFRVGRLSNSDEVREQGQLLWQQGKLHDQFQSLADLTSTTFVKSVRGAGCRCP